MAPDSSITGNLGILGKHWWGLLIRGIVAIAFGLAAFTWPGLTAAVLVLLFGFYALADGIFCLLSAFGPAREDRWLLVLEGIIGIWVGVVTLRSPAITAAVLVFLISIWAMATGILRIVGAIRLRRVIPGEVWLALSGVLAILFALLLMFHPVAGAVSVVWIIGAFALAIGVSEVILSFELKRVHPAH